MKCNSCLHQKVCLYLKSIGAFISEKGMDGILDLAVNDCIFHAIAGQTVSNQEEEVNIVQYDKNEEFIKDFNKRNELIKKSYRDAKGKEITCPSCKEKTTALHKCLECGKTVCEECSMIVSTNASNTGVLCEECWTKQTIKDDEEQASKVKIENVDSDFIINLVRKDIPEN